MFKSIYCYLNDLFINIISFFMLFGYKNTKLFGI